MTKTPVDSQTEVQLVFIKVLMTFRHVKYSPVCLWRSTMARVLQKVTDLQSYIRTSFETRHSTLQKASSCFLWPSSLIERSLSSLSNPSWVSVSVSACVFSYLLLSSSASSILSTSPSPQSDIILSLYPIYLSLVPLESCYPVAPPSLVLLEILQLWANPRACVSSSCRRDESHVRSL